MKTRYYILIVLAFMSSAILTAQDQSQAIRFSQSFPMGSARYSAMGGAFGAVGGDFSSIYGNPAGLGLFRSSEFTITPSFSINNSRSDFLGQNSDDNESLLRIANIGLVSAYSSDKSQGLVGSSIAFGYNTLNDFSSTTTMQGVNNTSSLMDNFEWYANKSNTLDVFYDDLAFETYLLPYDTIAQEYWHDFQPYGDYEGYSQEQLRVVERRGYIGEYAISGALNFSHKLYLGGTVGIQTVKYYEDVYHIETDVFDLSPDLESFEFGEYNSTRGYGYTLRVGMIYKPIHKLRIGASFQAPVVYQLTDDKYTEMDSHWDSNSGITDQRASSGLYSKEYELRTPFRASLSTAILLGKLGMISAEYEYVDYSSSDLYSPGYNFLEENIAISQDFKPTHNIKVGAEIVLNAVYLRGGVQYHMDPFTFDSNQSDLYTFSGGIGKRFGQTYIDFSYSYVASAELYGLYEYLDANQDVILETSENEYKRTNVKFTLGYKF